MSLAIMNTCANYDIVLTDGYGRRRGVHRQVPARVGGNEILQAVGAGSVIQERNSECTTIGAHHPTRRVHALSFTKRRSGRERDCNHSVGFRPDKWQAGTLILHTRPHDVAIVAHTESERSIGAW